MRKNGKIYNIISRIMPFLLKRKIFRADYNIFVAQYNLSTLSTIFCSANIGELALVNF